MVLLDDRDQILPAYAEGIRLFNAGQFFEAHEAWEGAWLRSEGRERMFYHGLIQAAAAFVHLQHNRRKGAQLLYLKSYDKLQNFSGTYKGLNIGQFNADMAALFAEVLDAAPETPINGEPVVARAPQIQWDGSFPVEVAAPHQPTVKAAFLKDENRGRAGS
ncbi:MAG: DUF309 domain-containing protein [bacterium]